MEDQQCRAWHSWIWAIQPFYLHYVYTCIICLFLKRKINTILYYTAYLELVDKVLGFTYEPRLCFTTCFIILFSFMWHCIQCICVLGTQFWSETLGLSQMIYYLSSSKATDWLLCSNLIIIFCCQFWKKIVPNRILSWTEVLFRVCATLSLSIAVYFLLPRTLRKK